MPKMSPELLPMSALALTPALPLVLALALGGCGGGENYPSLAQRPAELGYTMPPAPPKRASVAPTGPATPEPAIVRQVDALRTDAVRASQTFIQRANEAEHLARTAHGSPIGSEAWSATTVAMAALDAARSDTAQSLSELDALQAKMAVTAADSGNSRDKATFQVIAQADAAVGAMMEEQSARISALHALSGD